MCKLIFISFFIYSNIYCIAQDKTADSIPRLLQQLKNSAADTNRVGILLSISNAYTLKPGSEISDLNAAITHANNAVALSKTLNYSVGMGKSYIALSKALHEKGDKTNGERYAQHAIDVLNNTYSKVDAANAWMEKATYYDYYPTETLLKKIELYKQVVRLLKASGNKKAYADQLVFLADLTAIADDRLLSLQYLYEAMNVYHSIGFTDLRALYNILSTDYNLLNNFPEALKYGLLSAQMGEQGKDTTLQMSTIYNRLGITYSRIKQYDTAVQYFKKSIAIARNYKDTESIITIANNLAEALNNLKKPAEAAAYMQEIIKQYPLHDSLITIMAYSSLILSYHNMKKYTIAKKYFNDLQNITASLDKYDYYRSVFYKVGIPLLFDMKEYDNAEKMVAEYATNSNTDTSSLMMASTYLWKSRIDSANGNYLSAIKNNQKYNALMNVIYNETKTNQLASVQVQFDTEKKEQDILYLKHEAELQQTKFNQERFFRNVIIGSAILLVLILLLLYNRYRLKQKINKQLVSQQREINQKNQSLQELIQELHKLINEKEWLVKEIHHRVKNNLQIIVSLLNTQASHLNEGEALNAISESQHRMQAIALLHQKLYHLDNDSSIILNDYITEMVNYLKDCFPVNGIYFDIECDDIKLDVSQAAPVGLILNEAVTNAIKYAFPNHKSGMISIQLKRSIPNIISFIIADNGVGFPEKWNMQKKASMGIRLMETLTEQLEGTIHISSEKGVHINIQFYTKQEHLKTGSFTKQIISEYDA